MNINPVVEDLTRSLEAIKNDLSINGSLYTDVEQRMIFELVTNISNLIKMNLESGNYFY